MARVRRLDEAGLRRLVRGMLQEMGMPAMTRDQAFDEAERFTRDYFAALDATDEEDWEAAADVQAQFIPRLESIVRALMPRLSPQAAFVEIVPDYDHELKIRILDRQRKKLDYFHDLEDLIHAINWSRPLVVGHPRTP